MTGEPGSRLVRSIPQASSVNIVNSNVGSSSSVPVFLKVSVIGKGLFI